MGSKVLNQIISNFNDPTIRAIRYACETGAITRQEACGLIALRHWRLINK